MLGVGRYTTHMRILFVVLALAICSTQLWKHHSGPQEIGSADTGAQTHHEHEHPLSPSGSVEVGSEHRHCHFHAGIEHCTGPPPPDDLPTSPSRCSKVDQNYDIPMRLLFVFVVLMGSAIGVFVPLLLDTPKTSRNSPSRVTIALKQCGTGVIISTAFVHLFTHANLMFTNECLVGYELFEGTTATIFMAGMLLSFLVDFAAHYKAGSTHAAHAGAGTSESNSSAARPGRKGAPSNVMILEAGIVFHSVSGDSYFITLAIVITLHQMFEGLALGTRLAAMDDDNCHDEKRISRSHGVDVESPSHGRHSGSSPVQPLLPTHDSSNKGGRLGTRLSHTTASGETEGSASGLRALVPRGKHLLALCFTLVTPLGMLLGIALLGTFNGNNPSTIIAIGTLDALSAGILAWFGVVEMWAHDWLVEGAEMAAQDGTGVTVGLGSLVLGMVMMTVLGKWA
ncbi:hypothetical protein Micbo1qcDRAFT_178579 [Microdochium bolleyi]|uniref:ZIP zinc transporter-domain-containing protein n=1 Tax=Microdochium bolleyi TaxID=196109 RepID=A0A136ISP1_9PEZI|nr:hypothetical protein Micbo1qcDRAFT_178579 [Microdochium bolleyi]